MAQNGNQQETRTARPPENENDWTSPIIRIAMQLSNKAFPPHDMAHLAYRFDPRRPERNGGAFWRLMAGSRRPYAAGNVDEIDCWAVLIAGMARITSRGPSTVRGKRSPHDSARPVGRILYLGSERYATRPQYPEPAMQTLLSATGSSLRKQVTHAMNAIANQRANCDVNQLAELLRHDLAKSRKGLIKAREAIARYYYAP